MPTGYTACIEKGVTFEQYALGCARAFGALVMMRDEPADAPIPEKFEPSDWHLKALTEAQERLKSLDGLSVEAAQICADSDHREALKKREEQIAEKAELRRKYEDMLTTVRAWTPPTPEHKEFKKFMDEQIVMSMDSDCRVYPEEAPDPLTGRQWLDAEVESARRDIAYHTKEHAKEVERSKGRTEWVRQLREALK